MAFVALGVLGLIGLMLLTKLFVAANPAALAQGVRWAGLGVAALVVGTLAIRGQIEFAGFLLPVVYALARGWQQEAGELDLPAYRERADDQRRNAEAGPAHALRERRRIGRDEQLGEQHQADQPEHAERDERHLGSAIQLVGEAQRDAAAAAREI